MTAAKLSYESSRCACADRSMADLPSISADLNLQREHHGDFGGRGAGREHRVHGGPRANDRSSGPATLLGGVQHGCACRLQAGLHASHGCSGLHADRSLCRTPAPRVLLLCHESSATVVRMMQQWQRGRAPTPTPTTLQGCCFVELTDPYWLPLIISVVQVSISASILRPTPYCQ